LRFITSENVQRPTSNVQRSNFRQTLRMGIHADALTEQRG
jgi:hypothetical protein